MRIIALRPRLIYRALHLRRFSNEVFYKIGMHSHDRSQNADPSRRDFFRNLTRTTLAGVSALELAYYRAAWARAQAPTSDHQLFDIENVADGVYCAKARVQAEI